jgi:hypothetical protein
MADHASHAGSDNSFGREEVRVTLRVLLAWRMGSLDKIHLRTWRGTLCVRHAGDATPTERPG